MAPPAAAPAAARDRRRPVLIASPEESPLATAESSLPLSPPTSPAEVAELATEAVRATRERADLATVPPPVVLARGRTAWSVALVALCGFAVLFALVRAKRSAAADLAITMRFQRRRQPWLARTMAIVSWPGFPPQSRFLPPLYQGSLWLLGFRTEAVFQLLAWGASGLSFSVKRLMRRPRPDHPEIRVAVARIGGTSFPSGHVLNYMGTYGFLAYLAHVQLKAGALRRGIVGGLLALIALVGPSRIYLGHHWFTDVLASYLLGTCYLLGLTRR